MLRHVIVLMMGLLLYTSAAGSESEAAVERRPVTVADFDGIVSFANSAGRAVRDVLLVSPDQRKFVTVLERGDHTTGLITYSLVLFDADEVRAFVSRAQPGPLPRATVLARFETSAHIGHGVLAEAPKAGIFGVRWMSDSHTLAFVGRDHEGLGQVYVLDIPTRTMHSLTPNPRGYIVSFDLSRAHQRLGYAATVAPDEASWQAFLKEHTVGVGPYAWLVPYWFNGFDPLEVSGHNVRYFSVDLAQQRTMNVAVEPGAYASTHYELRIDPTGHWAVGLSDVSVVPARWIAYPEIGRAGVRIKPRTQVLEYENPALGRLSAKQLQLIDLVTGAARPLLDAPAGWAVLQTAWSADGRHVLVYPTAVPLRDVQYEPSQKARSEAVVDVDISNGTYTVVADTPPFQGGQASDSRVVRYVRGVEWTPEGRVRILWVKADNNTQRKDLAWVEYRRRGTSWTKTRSHAVADNPQEVAMGDLGLSMPQAPNTPPEIVARDLKTGRERAITDLNPQLRKLALAQAEPFTWLDRFGRTVEGRLYRPTGARPQHGYPVVLQAALRDAASFTLGGTGVDVAPYAAQVLVGYGMLVLTLPANESPGASKGPTETEYFTEMVERAIDALDARGLIDRAHIGLIGFSRNGMRTHFAITFSKYPIAAAVVCDAIGLTPWNYATTYGTFPGMTSASHEWGEDVPSAPIGAPLWGEQNIRRWTERSYLFHLQRIPTAILYEDRGPQYPSQWEPFAILKSFGRPVEMFRQIRSAHGAPSPDAAYVSRDRAVDWMRFWLQDAVDADPAKAEQYTRWREMREFAHKHAAQAALTRALP